MALVEINVPELSCKKKKCGHKWTPRPKKENIEVIDKIQYLRVGRCPKCKSIHWDKK